MKKLLLLALFFQCSLIFSQNNDIKQDNTWLFGYDSYYNLTSPKSGNTIVNFNTKPPANYFQYTDMNFNDDIAIISDTSGQLLFYTNGIYIADKMHQPMLNGTGLNPGKEADKNVKYGYINCQGAIILPQPNTTNLYYLIHSSIHFDLVDAPKTYKGEKLYYSIIDISKNEGRGEVIEKNKVLLDSKKLDIGKITACRHANGKDWWIIIADFDNKNFNTFLLSDKGIEIKEKQKFKFGERGGLGQTCFSPDGTKYIRFNADFIYKTELSVFDFDRCTGKLSNLQYLESTKDTVYAIGMAISPNSKYLYASYYTKIYQYDLESKDIFSTKDTVAIYDGFIDPAFGLPTTFYLSQLAPDGKIYMSMPNTSMYLHVIHEPNKKGKACNVEQHSFKLARKNYTTMPNFPNFRLGKAAQPCEMVGNEEVEKVKYEVKLYPNPSDGNLIFDNGVAINTTLYIYDINGKVILSQNISDKLTPINISYLSNGLYYCRVLGEENIIKFTIIH